MPRGSPKSGGEYGPNEAPHSPEVLSQHGLTGEEYERILKALGREPKRTELGLFSVMWSEHCS